MTHLRKSMVLTAVYFAFVFSLGRFDFLGQGLIHLHGYLYVLLLTALICAMMMPSKLAVSAQLWGLSWLGVYFLIRLLSWQADPPGGGQLYLTLIECALLAMGVLILRDLDQQMRDYEGALGEIGLPKVKQKVYAWDEAADLIKTEFIRSRRYNHTLSMMVIEPTSDSLKTQLNRSGQDVQRIMMGRFVHTSLARLAASEARRTDLVVELETDKRILVLFPETRPEGLGIFAGRLQRMAQEELGLRLNFGIASFPEDAMTFEDLQQKAIFNLLDPKRAVFEASEQQYKQGAGVR